MRSFRNPKTKRVNVIYDCECGKKEFKKKISELCDECELKPLIEEGIKNQILQEAEIQKENLTKEQFDKYIEEEIDSSKKAITERLLLQRRQKEIDPNNNYVGSRIMGVIWNSERIKALNEILNSSESEFKLFKKVEDLKRFKEFSKIPSEDKYSDYSYFFKRLLREKKIHQHKDKELFSYLLNNHFIDNDTYKSYMIKGGFKSEGKSESKNRKKVYNEFFE